jgi:hypothetical protein
MTTCPKCGYVRKPTDTVPDWECPSCNIAYAKYHPAPPPVAADAAAAAPAIAPIHGKYMDLQPVDAGDGRRMYEIQFTSPLPGAIFGAVLALPGMWFLLKGLSVIRSSGRPEWWTDAPEVMLGATLFGAGCWLMLKTLGLGERATRATGHAIWACLAMVYTWGITITGFDALMFTSMGPMSGVRFWRALVVAFDLYVALSIFENVLDELGNAPAATRNRFAYAVGCIAVAFTLELSGGMAKVYAKLGLRLPGPAATIGLLQSNHFHPAVPDLPLEEFAGDWVGVFQKKMPGSFGHGPGAITRVQVSVANGQAFMHLWRWCPPQECDGGSHPAIIDSRRPGTVVGLHVTGTTNGEDWLVTLSTQPGHMNLEDQRIRGKDMNTRRQYGDWMARPDDVRLK